MNTGGGTRQYTVALRIDRTELERLYRGQARAVVARDTQGRTVRFPALSLQPFIGHSGVEGTFVITVDAGNRLLDIRRLVG